jgi:diguanylate cyclase (GGDEF)-like protein
MHQLLPISHAQLVLCGILVFMQAISSFRRHGRSLVRGSMRSNRAIMIAFLIFMACSVTDFILFRVSSIDVLDSAFFMRHGLFAFSMVLAIEAFRTSMSYMRRAERAEAVEAVAYVDALTGIGNRSAWKAMRIEMDEALKTEQIDDALVCQFDVNYLKKINDTYGHAEGDRALVIIGNSLRQAAGAAGFPVFISRYGGDEFVIILHCREEKAPEILADAIRSKIKENSEAAGVPYTISIAFGYDELSPYGETFADCLKRADEKSYKDKEAQKGLIKSSN